MIAEILGVVRAHAAALVIVLPFLGAAAAVAIGRAHVSWAAAVLVSAASVMVSVDLVARSLLGESVGAAIGGMPIAPDELGVTSLALIAVAGLLALISAVAFFSEYDAGTAPFAVALLLCMQAGWSGAVVARDFTSLFLFVEIGWFASVGLVAMSALRNRAALNGALRMLLNGAVASALLLLGVALAERGLGPLIADLSRQRRLVLDSLQGEMRAVKDVVEESNGRRNDAVQPIVIDRRLPRTDRHEVGHIDRAEGTGFVGEEGLLPAGVGGFDLSQPGSGVCPVDRIQENHAGFSGLPGGLHQLIEDGPGRHTADNLARVRIDQRKSPATLYGLHEAVGDADRQVEIRHF